MSPRTHDARRGSEWYEPEVQLIPLHGEARLNPTQDVKGGEMVPSPPSSPGLGAKAGPGSPGHGAQLGSGCQVSYMATGYKPDVDFNTKPSGWTTQFEKYGYEDDNGQFTAGDRARKEKAKAVARGLAMKEEKSYSIKKNDITMEDGHGDTSALSSMGGFQIGLKFEAPSKPY